MHSVHTQYALRNISSHSVVLDVLVEDLNHKLYNVEIQVADNDDHIKRVRYYQAAIDWSVLQKGKKYSELPELYLIYISMFDIFKQDKSCYEISRTVKGILGTGLAASGAAAAVDRTVQLNNALAARGLMQPVDVLRDNGAQLSFPLKLGKPPVRHVRLHRFVRDELGAVKAEEFFRVLLEKTCGSGSSPGIFIFLPVQPSVLRKSGMPDSVDTPAPPKKTMLSLPAIHSQSTAILSCMETLPFY